jgi:hypothetical protein
MTVNQKRRSKRQILGLNLAILSWAGFAAMTAMFYLAMVKPANSADRRPEQGSTIDLSRADWQAVPNGKKPTAFWVDTKGFRRKKSENIVTYDLIDEEAGYSRIETDCTKLRFRAIRQGYMSETAGKAIYTAFPQAEWQNYQNDSLKTSVGKFVCALKPGEAKAN